MFKSIWLKNLCIHIEYDKTNIPALLLLKLLEKDGDTIIFIGVGIYKFYFDIWLQLV